MKISAHQDPSRLGWIITTTVDDFELNETDFRIPVGGLTGAQILHLLFSIARRTDGFDLPHGTTCMCTRCTTSVIDTGRKGPAVAVDQKKTEERKKQW